MNEEQMWKNFKMYRVHEVGLIFWGTRFNPEQSCSVILNEVSPSITPAESVPNAIKHLTSIRKMLASNLGQETSYPYRGFRGFSQTL
jgi:hypothetical protein